jgi:hypothetical protein
MTLYHISENPDIKVFEPRPSPSQYNSINEDIVFAVSDRFLYNYLLPRECPRVSYYANALSSQKDVDTYIGSGANRIVVTESKWKDRIAATTLYCYGFSPESFSLLDANAGYYISKEKVYPVSTRVVIDLPERLKERNVDLRYVPSLFDIARKIQESTLSFSLIRMRNAS